MSNFLELLKQKFEPVPETLFHYSSQAGLIGIIKGGEMWMTHTQFLNDTQEYNHAIVMIASEMAERIKTAPANEISILEVILKQITHDLSQINVCVCCFSEDGDSLSQWRAYGSSAASCSIGFCGESLASIASGTL